MIDLEDQGPVKAYSYIEYAPSLLQLIGDSYSVHIDFELHDRVLDRVGPMIEAIDERQFLPTWITYY